jgi:Muramidase (flagellum-specific)
MKSRILNAVKVIVMLGVCMAGITLMYAHEGKASQPLPSNQADTIAIAPQFFSLPAKEGLKEALTYYDIQHPDIVYAQAILETGHFKSQGCTRDNNLFGLYNSRARRYCKFNHWTESVVAYKEWIQRRYKPPADYYAFLQRIRYASDPLYIKKLKTIVKQENDKRRYTDRDTLS